MGFMDGKEKTYMKQGKTLTRNEKEALSRANRNWKDWLSIPTDCEMKHRFINKNDGKIILVDKR